MEDFPRKSYTSWERNRVDDHLMSHYIRIKMKDQCRFEMLESPEAVVLFLNTLMYREVRLVG